MTSPFNSEMEVNQREEDGNYKIRESISPYKQSNLPHNTFPLLESQELFDETNINEFQNKNTSSCETGYLNEPRAKKRRKQSNPLRYQTTLLSNFDDDQEDYLVNNNSEDTVTLEEKCEKEQLDHIGNFQCQHCVRTFPTSDILRVHLEEEHVSKLLEKQLNKQTFNKSASINEHESNFDLAKDNSPPNDCPLQLSSEKWLYSNISNNQTQEDKNTPFSLPNIPPLVAVSEGVENQSRNISLPLPMFHNSMTPLFFPVSPHAQNSSLANGNSNTSTGLRIFNPEAYCELCNKEFCNKYFLKTHKANKHGIYSLDSIPSSSCSRAFNSNGSKNMPISQFLSTEFPSTVHTTNITAGLTSNLAASLTSNMTGSLTSNITTNLTPNISSSLTPNISSSLTPNISSSLTPNISSSLTPNISTSLTPNISTSLTPNISTSLTPNISTSLTPNISTSLTPNISTSLTPNISTSLTPNISTTLTSNITSSTPNITASLTPNLSTNLTPTLTPNLTPNLDSYCEICQKEFCNKYFLRKHKQKIHGIVDLSQNSSPINNDIKNITFTSSSNSPSFITTVDKSVKSVQDLLNDHTRTESNNGQESQRIQIPISQVSNRLTYFPLPPNADDKQNSQDSTTNENKSVFTKDKLREMGVINLEAFCEICCKEFCNKYFLRTHKLNMHGIGTPESPNKIQNQLPQPQMQPLQLTTTDKYDALTNDKENEYRIIEAQGENLISATGTSGELSCSICNRPFASPYLLKMHKFYTHNIPFNKEENQSYSSSEEQENHQNRHNEPLQPPPFQENNLIPDDTVSQDLQKLQSMIKELNASTVLETNKVCCNLCHLEFDNKYFLRAHVMNEHGVLTNEDGNVHSVNRELNPSGIICSGNNEIQRSSNSTVISDINSRVRCEICQKEFCSMYFLKSHKLNIHGICPENNSVSKPLLPISEDMNITKSEGNSVNSATSKSPIITGRNYCNICNKELCNKYFMKTHMLKMHGIDVETQANEAALNSSIGGVTCDICQKELCSKYFLKVHKQNTHGIAEEPSITCKESASYSNQSDKESLAKSEESDFSSRYFSYYTEVCPICDRRFKSIKWLKTHMINDHDEIIKEKLCLQIENFNPGSNLFCFICNQIFADKIALQIHLIKDHHTTPEDLGILNNSGTKLQPTSSGVVIPDLPDMNGTLTTANNSLLNDPQLHNKRLGGSSTRIYHCSYCVYSTRWLSNLYAHEKRHTGINIEGEKKFVCRICYRAYRYNHSLQRHMLSHKSVGLSLKSSISTCSSQQIPNSTLSLLSNTKENIPNDMPEPQDQLKIKRYRCSKCNKKFLTREMCLTHIHSTHKGRRLDISQQKFIKSFRCHVCNFVTRAWNILKIHIRKHHPQEVNDNEEITELPTNAMLEYPTSVGTSATGGLLSTHLPMTYAMPQNPPQSGSYIMQPFLLAQPEKEGNSKGNAFVPSLVYLPVCQKVLQPLTVPLTLTPA